MSDTNSTAITQTVAELIPKEDKDLTKEEREIKKLRGKLYGICDDAVSYLHSVIKGEKGNRTRMRACESFMRFLPALDEQVSTQPLHLHLAVPRPKKKEEVTTIQSIPVPNKDS